MTSNTRYPSFSNISTVLSDATTRRTGLRSVTGREPLHTVLTDVEPPRRGLLNVPYFETYQDERQEWRWRFKAANHEPIASGEGYRNRADCLRAIELLKASSSAPVY